MDLHTHTDCISHGPAHRGCISHGPAHTHRLQQSWTCTHTHTLHQSWTCTHIQRLHQSWTYTHTPTAHRQRLHQSWTCTQRCISHGPAHIHTHSLHQSWTCYTDQDWVSTRGFPLYTCTMNTSIVSPLIVSSSNTLKKCLAKVKAIKFNITWTVRYWNMVLYNFGQATQRYPLLCHGRFGSMTLPWQVFLQKNLTHIFHRTFSSDIAIFNIHLKKSYNNKKPPSYDFKKKKIISIWHFHTTPYLQPTQWSL